MVRFILFLAAKAVAFACGANILEFAWLTATLVIDYVRAIFSESKHAQDGDFRNLTDGEFMKSESNIKMKTVWNLLGSAAFFTVGFLVNSFGWV